MTDKPLLTPKQENKTLSAKKKKKRPLKQTLIKPQLHQYRPSASKKECDLIIDAVNKLPRLMPTKTSIEWSIIKDVPKEERKAVRAQLQQISSHPDLQEFRKHIILGINKVTEHLERNKLDAVLLSSDIEPFYMAQHVLELCVMKHVYVLIIDELRKTLHINLGIASTCMGIAKGHTLNELKALHDKIQNVCENYPQPSEESTDKMIIKLVNDSESSLEIKNTAHPVNAGNEVTYKNVHLKREGTERIFKPERVQRNKAFNADFIQFAAPATVISKKFIGMQVAKLKANSARDSSGKRKTHGQGWFNAKSNSFKPNKGQIRKHLHS